MKAKLPALGAALVAALAVTSAPAEDSPGGHCFFHVAPDACGPGYYAPNEYGLWFGPNYDVYPPCGPFNGVPFQFSPKEEEGQSGAPGGQGASGAPGGPAGPYGPYGYGAPRAPVGPYGPYGYYGPRPPYPAGPYAWNGGARPGAPGAQGVEPGPYRGPIGGEALQGPGCAAPGGPLAQHAPYDRYLAGPYGPYALNGAAGPYGPSAAGPGAAARPEQAARPNGFNFSFNTGGPAAPGGPNGPSPYGPGGRMIASYGVDGCPVVPGPMSFPTHMWARSPRDFFMEGDETPPYNGPVGYGAPPGGYGPAPSQPVYSPPTAPPRPPTPPPEVPR